jgi:hypothetical protein
MRAGRGCLAGTLSGQSKRLPEIGRARVAVALVILSCWGCKLPPPASPETRVLVVAVDSSPSSRAGDRCAEVQARVEAAISDPAAAALDVLVLASGDDLEPATVIPWEHFSPAERLYGDLDAEELERDTVINRFGARCRARLRASARSPIFQLVKRGTEALQARCAEIEKAGGRCAPTSILALQSDLRENVESSISVHSYARRGVARKLPVPTLENR